MTRHGPVTVAVLGGGDPRRAMTVRDAIRDLLGARTGPSSWRVRPVDTAGGRVALVGAGPGDPELITVKGRRLLTEADVVVADRLVPGLLLDELRAGRRAGGRLEDPLRAVPGPGGDQPHPGRPRPGRRLRGPAQGRRPVRLRPRRRGAAGLRGGRRAGDRGARGDQLDRRARPRPASRSPTGAWRTSSQWSPGTWRPTRPPRWCAGRPWRGLRGTLVILMGLKNLAAITATLIAHGRPPDTPAAVVQEATTGGAAGAAVHARRGSRRRAHGGGAAAGRGRGGRRGGRTRRLRGAVQLRRYLRPVAIVASQLRCRQARHRFLAIRARARLAGPDAAPCSPGCSVRLGIPCRRSA